MEREIRAETPYPYAEAKTFLFLKAAIAEGAHLETPKYIGDKGWARMRNIAGIYFSTDLKLEDIGKMYAFKARNKRSRPQQLIKRFLDHMWENSSPLLRALVPRGELSSKKPFIPGQEKEKWRELELLIL